MSVRKKKISRSFSRYSPEMVGKLFIQKFVYNPISGRLTNIHGFSSTKGFGNGYSARVSVSYKGICYSVNPHRLIYFLKTGVILKKSEQIDHINRIRSDNKWKNLRKCSRKENMQNKSKYKGKYKGVYFDNLRHKFGSAISVNSKILTIGWFKSQTLAAQFYDSAARYYQKSFANCNFKKQFIPTLSIKDLRDYKKVNYFRK